MFAAAGANCTALERAAKSVERPFPSARMSPFACAKMIFCACVSVEASRAAALPVSVAIRDARTKTACAPWPLRSPSFNFTSPSKSICDQPPVDANSTLPSGRPVQTATARDGKVELASTGGWAQMGLEGGVKLKDGDRSGQGAHAVFVRSSQIATLTGNAAARDASTETHAQKIIFAQASGDIRAEGGVRSTDFASRSSAVQLAPAAANITADTLQANSKAGRALYSGHARLWQGDSVLEAESIELLRDTRVLNAAGNFPAGFPQASPQSAENSAAGGLVAGE